MPVLITEEVAAWFEKILHHRSVFLPSSNRFLFATATENSHYGGSDVLRQFAMACGASKPELLTLTKLRNHIASTCTVCCQS